MARAASVKGLNKVAKNLNKEIRAIKHRTDQGLLKVTIFLRQEMDTTYPVIPVGDTNNLRSSWTNTMVIKGKIRGRAIGFTANYAAAVHEMVDKQGKKINWTRPNSGPKFLEAHLLRNRSAILSILALDISPDTALGRRSNRPLVKRRTR